MNPVRNLLLVVVAVLFSILIARMAAEDRHKRELLDVLGLAAPGVKPTIPTRREPDFRPQPGRIFRHPEASACVPRQPTNTAEILPQRIYRWQDEDGKTHFSDRLPERGQAEVVRGLPSFTLDEFELRLSFDGMPALPGFQDQVNSGSERIYRFFRTHLNQGKIAALQVNLVVAGSTRRFEHHRRALAPAVKTQSGFYDFATNQALVRHYPKSPERTLAVSFHEITHLIVGNVYGRVDTWLNEGLAELFERTLTRLQSTEATVSRRDVEYLRNAVRRGKLPSLHKLLTSGYPYWYGTDTRLMYLYAWSLVHYLLGDDETKALLEDLLRAQKTQRCQSFSSADFLQVHYPGGLEALGDAWRRWLFDEGNKALYY